MITSKITDLHYSYFRFFLEQLKNLKYEVFYEMDKKLVCETQGTIKVCTIIAMKLYNSYFRFFSRAITKSKI